MDDSQLTIIWRPSNNVTRMVNTFSKGTLWSRLSRWAITCITLDELVASNIGIEKFVPSLSERQSILGSSYPLGLGCWYVFSPFSPSRACSSQSILGFLTPTESHLPHFRECFKENEHVELLSFCFFCQSFFDNTHDHIPTFSACRWKRLFKNNPSLWMFDPCLCKEMSLSLIRIMKSSDKCKLFVLLTSWIAI